MYTHSRQSLGESRPSPITIYNYRDLLIKAELLIGHMIIIFVPMIRPRMRTD